MNAHFIEDQTKATRVADRLRTDILNKVFPAGSRITIKEICERYGVSNVPVREALRTLESEHLVEISAYKGATILQIDRSYISDIYGILRALQLTAYEKALPYLTEECLQHVRDINETIGSLQDTPEDRLRYIELDHSFHDAISALSANQPAVELYRTHYRMISSVRRAYTPVYTRIRAAYEEHKGIIEALEKRDVLLLKTSIDRHGAGAEANFMVQYDREH